jgi:hypothetical protein
VVGVPVAANILLLIGILSHLSDRRIAIDGLKEAVQVDAAEVLSEGEMLLGGELLIPEEYDAELPQGPSNRINGDRH